MSRVDLGHGRVGEIAQVVESVHGALALFPLRLLPEKRDGRERSRHVVRILPTQKEYLAGGGAEGTVGYYNGRTGEVVVNLERLIEPKGPRSNLEPRQRYRLLVHELVHQAMGDRLGYVPAWLSEGLAEYFAATQFAPGRYRFENCERAIIDHLNAVWLHGRRELALPEVGSLITMSSHVWAADNRKNAEGAYSKYAGALLLTHYQMELASRGLGGLGEFLETGPRRVPIPGAPRRYRLLPPSQDVLWDGRTPEAVQRGLTKFWKAKGLELRFQPTRPLPAGE